MKTRGIDSKRLPIRNEIRIEFKVQDERPSVAHAGAEAGSDEGRRISDPDTYARMAWDCQARLIPINQNLPVRCFLTFNLRTAFASGDRECFDAPPRGN